MVLYWQRHGSCSLILAQHSFDGWTFDDMMAFAHELSCAGLHVTAATEPFGLSLASTNTNTATATTSTEAFILGTWAAS
ncbi:hypothetical protein Ancab_034794 [Ancistrocladus abbreviatus]